MRVASSPSCQSVLTVTSKCSRSSSMPDSPMFSATRTRVMPSPPSRSRSTTQSMQAVSACDVGRLDRREHRDRAAGCGRACGRARRRRCRWRAASRRRPRRRRLSSKSIVPTTSERLRGVGDERRGEAPWPRPSRRGAPEDAVVRPTQQSRPPPRVHPVELLGEQQQRRDRRRVVGLVLEGVVERGGERQEVRDPAVGRPRSRRSAPAPRGSAARATARRRRRTHFCGAK